MPFSEDMPTLVYPDEPRARIAMRKEVRPDMWGDVAFCHSFKPRNGNKDKCANADSGGVRSHNWCFRCPCGYQFMRLDEKDMNLLRDRPSTTTGY